MTDAMNLHSFPQRDDGRTPPAPRRRRRAAAGLAATRRSARSSRSAAAAPGSRSSSRRLIELGRRPRSERSPCRARSAARSRSPRAAAGCSPTSARLKVTDAEAGARHRRDRLPRRGRRGPADRQAGQLQARHHLLSDPRQQGLSGLRRRSEADVRRRRARPYRDRHRLSDQGRARRALCRCPARQAFRAARLDRHRQVDRRRSDHAPDLRPVARGPYRDDRPARRIFGRVQGPWRAVQRRQSRHALLADELRGALRGVRHLAGRRAPARHGHPRQMPAPGARQEPRRRGPFQAHRRFADPLHPVGPHQRDHPRNGPARTRRPTPRPTCGSRPRSTS